jgi:polyphosphate kinase
VQKIDLRPIKEFLETHDGLPYIHRDISWLSFNHRVLQEAMDNSVPLLERLKFLAIYSSNLDEYFKVRMAYHRYLARVGKTTKGQLEYDPKSAIKEIRRIVNLQQEIFSQVFDKMILPELKKHNIRLLRRMELNEEQQVFVENFFKDNMLPYVQPVLLHQKRVRPFLNNGALYLTLWLKPIEDPHGHDEYALLKMPSDQLPRFIELPSTHGQHDLIMLDDIVRHSVSWMFPGYEIEDTFSIKLTRDAQLYIDDEFSGDLVSKIRNSLNKRMVGTTSRFVFDREMPEKMLEELKDVFTLEKNDTLREGRYHNNFDFFKFPDFGKKHLKNPDLPSLPHPILIDPDTDFFGEIAKQDQLLYFPYQTYDPVIRFFEEAAKDPKVTHIKLTQYRVSKNSRIMKSLIEAVENGKQVSVFIEVKARFDEEANLGWGEILKKAGVQVHYSFPGVKVHAKLALVRRMEPKGLKMYAYLSTGNFHEDTAKIYTDFGMLTSNQDLCNETARIFNFLETTKKPTQSFKHFLVGQFNLRADLEKLIDKEIAQAKKGKPANIIIKVNSLQDNDMVKKLYEASKAGVKVQLIVRGICSLVPGIKGYSENIKAISIVDRFLEHARVFIFHNSGDTKLYLSSADWMTRNLSFRVETAFPIYDPQVKAEILDYIQLQLSDNVKARKLDKNLQNNYHKGNSDFPVRSQVETYYMVKRKLEGMGKEEG